MILSAFLLHLRQMASRKPAEAGDDGALLARFIRDHDEDAFSALVARHAPLVLGVCKRVLADTHAGRAACLPFPCCGDGRADLAAFGYTLTGVGWGGPTAAYIWLQPAK